jgi:hypothetical protein
MPDFIVSKQFDTDLQVPPISPELKSRIEALAHGPVPDEQVYVAQAKLANDQVDRSYERFPVEYLQRFAETIPGKALLPGHDQSAVPIGRWIDGAVERDTNGVHHLVARFYVAAKSDLATRLRLGIAKDVSIRFKAAGRTCDLCGEAYDGPKRCEHNKGQEYDGRVCTVTYSGDARRVEALEGSLVWLACQTGAQVTGAKAAGAFGGQVLSFEGHGGEDVTREEEAALQAKVAEQEDEIKRLKLFEAKAKDGDAYQAMLKTQIAKNMAAVKGTPHDAEHPNPEIGMVLKTLEGANTDTLLAWDKLWQEQFDQKFPSGPQSKQLGEGAVQAPMGVPGDRPPLAFDPHASLKGAI